MASYDELRRQYIKAAKKADQRMVRLEALSHEKGYKHVLEWAYAKASIDIERYEGHKVSPGERPRWNRAIPTDERMLREKLADVQHFLDSATSTKKGITKTYKDRVETTNKKYGTDFDWRTFADFAESNLWDDLIEYGSGTLFDVIAQMQKDKDKITKKYNELKEQHKTITADDLNYNVVLSDAIADELQKNGLSIFDMI